MITVYIVELKDNVSEHRSIGIGRTEKQAQEDAIGHFMHRPTHVIERRIKAGDAIFTNHTRYLDS